MKASRRLLAMVLAVTMVFSMGLTGAFATGGAQDSGITATAEAASTTIEVGEKTTVSVTAKFVDSGNREADLTENTDYTVTYSSSASGTASVDNKGTVIGAAAGDVTITAQITGIGSYDGFSTSATTATITVKKVTPPTVDKATLTAAITAATAAKSTAAVSTDGTDVEPAKKWVTQSVMDTFTTAIATAQAVVDNTDATAQDVKDATTTLNNAKTAFEKARADGKKPVTPPVGTASIKATVKESMELNVGENETIAITKVEYIDSGTPPTTKPVEANDYKVGYMANGTTVVAVGLDGKVIAGKVGNAKITVTVTGKDGTKYAGLTDTKTVTVTVSKADVEGLITGIPEAETKSKGVVTSKNNGEDILEGTKWVSEAAMKALTDALNVAKELVAKGEAASQPAVTAAETALDAAIAGFKPADGKKVNPPRPGQLDKTKLDIAIATAHQTNNDARIAEKASDVQKGVKWATAADKAVFAKAIDAAREVRNTATEQTAINAAVTTLTAAQAKFEATVKLGERVIVAPPEPEEPNTDEVKKGDQAVAGAGTAAKDELKTGLKDAEGFAETPAEKDAVKAVQTVVNTTSATTAELTKAMKDNFSKLPEAVQETVKYTVLYQVFDAANTIADLEPADKEAMKNTDIVALEELMASVGLPMAKPEVAAGAVAPAKMSGATLSMDEDGNEVVVKIAKPQQAPNVIVPNLPSDTKNTAALSLNLTVGGEKAWVKAPITFTFNRSALGLTNSAYNVKVYHVDGSGRAVELSNAVVNGSTVTFTVGSFSSIVFAEVPGGTTNNGGGSSSGGGSKSSLTFGGAFDTKTENTSANVGANGAVNATAAANDATKAVKDALAKKTTASVSVTNAQTITPDALKAIADAAKKAGGVVTVNADTTYAGKTIARISIDPAKAAALGKEIKLSVATDSSSVAATKTRFDKFFTNKMAIASFAQQGSFGMTVNAAVRVDLTGLNAKTLRLYSFDKATNKYVPISTQGMFVDANGFLHFNTSLGGDILITDAPLTAKK